MFFFCFCFWNLILIFRKKKTTEKKTTISKIQFTKNATETGNIVNKVLEFKGGKELITPAY